jgi:hypothetical protein
VELDQQSLPIVWFWAWGWHLKRTVFSIQSMYSKYIIQSTHTHTHTHTNTNTHTWEAQSIYGGKTGLLWILSFHYFGTCLTMVFFVCFNFWDRVMICSPCWPWTLDPPASISRCWGWQGYTTIMYFHSKYPLNYILCHHTAYSLQLINSTTQIYLSNMLKHAKNIPAIFVWCGNTKLNLQKYEHLYKYFNLNIY